MPTHDLEQYLFDLKNDPEMQAELKSKNPRLAGYKLADAERRAIQDSDVVALWRLGVHPLLLVPFSRFVGIPAPEYYARLRAAGATTRLSSAETV